MNLEDIALKAGVSRSTVSRVINNDPHVSKRTHKLVMEVINQENFQPNPSARALVTRRTEIIGVVIPTSDNVFFADNSYFPMLLSGINDTARALDYAMLLWLGELLDSNDRGVQKITNNRLVDGLVIASLPADNPLFSRLLSLKSPYVMVDCPEKFEDQISYVSIDNIAAAEAATNHLISLGRRRIAHIAGYMAIADARDRLQGYKNALANAGIPYDHNLVFSSGRFSVETGFEGLKQLMSHQPDAVFAAGDTIAIGVIRAAHELGVKIPGDLSLIGFDDIDVATQAIPNLTTIRQPVQQKGEVAAKLLIDLINGRAESPQHILLPTELIIRQSCGGLAS